MKLAFLKDGLFSVMLDKFTTALIEISYSLGILSSRTCIYSFILIMYLFTHAMNNSWRGEKKKRDCKINRKLSTIRDGPGESYHLSSSSSLLNFSFFLSCLIFVFYFILLKRKHKGGSWAPNATNMKYSEWNLSQKRSRNSEIRFLQS